MSRWCFVGAQVGRPDGAIGEAVEPPRYAFLPMAGARGVPPSLSEDSPNPYRIGLDFLKMGEWWGRWARVQVHFSWYAPWNDPDDPDPPDDGLTSGDYTLPMDGTQGGFSDERKTTAAIFGVSDEEVVEDTPISFFIEFRILTAEDGPAYYYDPGSGLFFPHIKVDFTGAGTPVPEGSTLPFEPGDGFNLGKFSVTLMGVTIPFYVASSNLRPLLAWDMEITALEWFKFARADGSEPIFDAATGRQLRDHRTTAR